MAASKPCPYAFFEEKIVPVEEAKISIMTNGLHYGVGVFGGIKAFKTPKGVAIFRLSDHIKRISDSIKILNFPFEFDVAAVKKTILELAEANKLTETTYIRPIVYRSDTVLSPDIAGKYSLAIYMLPMSNYFDPNKGLDVCVSSWQRNSDQAIPPRTKATGGYINSALAINEAHENGYDSAIMLDKNGHVSEGAVMNIFLVKKGVLITPSLDSDILEGITRRTIIELAQEMGLKVEERIVDRSELYTADEVFFTGTAANVTWCKSIDKTEISAAAGPITIKFINAFTDLHQTHPQHFTKI